MLRAILFAAGFAVLAVNPGWSATARDLAKVLDVADMIDIMRTEGRADAADLAEELIPGGVSTYWLEQVDTIYAAPKMTEMLVQGLEQSMTTAEIDAAVAFFDGELGRRILSLENSARAAMIDQSVEDFARDAYIEKLDQGDPKLDAVTDFVQANDLLERNVAGAMSATYQFYAGMSQGGALDMDEQAMLSDIWAQEKELRNDTEAWLFGYLLMAYQPLSIAEIETYTEYSKTEDGQALNAALFDGFDAMYRSISFALGLAIAEAMQGSDL